MQSRDHADSEHELFVSVDRTSAEFVCNKHTNKFIHVQTFSVIY